MKNLCYGVLILKEFGKVMYLKYNNLVNIKKRGSGRNNNGRITVHHRGGGIKHTYRQIDFKRSIWNIKGFVKAFFYSDLSSPVALVCYQNGIIAYIPLFINLPLNGFIINSDKAPIKVGNTLPLKNIPLGVSISNIEVFQGRGAQLARSPGVFARIIKKDFFLKKATILLSNKKKFNINLNCIASIGIVQPYKKKNYLKAGNKRLLGFRPVVRGVAMNPVDHPMGGGEGKTSGGRCSVSPWGKLAKSGKTRKSKKYYFNIECGVNGNIEN